MPVDLDGVCLASCVSGKGLRAFSGLSMVFYNHPIAASLQKLPQYLDLGFYAAQHGMPFTSSSNLILALEKSLERLNEEDRFREVGNLSRWLKSELRKKGLPILVPDEYSAPAVITIPMPQGISSKMIGEQLDEKGYSLSYRSQYLLDRNWIQICLMGECSQRTIAPLLELLSMLVSSTNNQH